MSIDHTASVEKAGLGGEVGPDYAGGRMDCLDPATGEVLARVGIAREADIDAAVAAARKSLTRLVTSASFGVKL